MQSIKRTFFKLIAKRLNYIRIYREKCYCTMFH